MQPKKTLNRKILAGLAVTASAAILGGAALAHAGDQAGGDCGGPRHWGARNGDPQAAMQKHLDKLQADLKLQPNQQGAWQAYVTQMQANMQKMQAAHQAAKTSADTTLTLPQRLDRRETLMQSRLTDMQAADTALKALYAALTPAQQAIMDQHFAHGKGRHV